VRHHEFTAAGAIVAAVVVDDPKQNAAMVEKLKLPFPILSDPGRDLAIEPYGVADPKDPREIAIPTTVVIDAAGNEVWRKQSFDFAERPEEDAILEVVRGLGLSPTSQEMAPPVDAEPGAKAMPFPALTAYYRGAKFAAIAMSRRFPEAKDNAKAYAAQMDRYIEAVHEIRD
jgi:alkyl hydroperoxide reductase subunit AhpC